MSQIKKKFVGANEIDETKIRLNNNVSLRGRNNADSADVNIAYVGSDDGIHFPTYAFLDGGVDLSGNTIDNIGTPTIASQAANKSYVDTVAAGLSWKNSVRAATSAALPSCTYANGTGGVGATLTATANGALSSQDGVTLVANDRLLVKNQASGLQNGIYVVTQVGDGSNPFILTRTTDFDSSAEMLSGAMFVQEGTANGDKQFVCITDAPITVGTTALSFTIYGSATATTPNIQSFTLAGGDITNQYIDLAQVAITNSIIFFVRGGGMMEHGQDYTINYTGGGGGVTRISFANDLATGGNSALIAGDVVKVHYIY